MDPQREIGDQLVDTLLGLQVEVVFTLCGNHILPVYEALRESGIRVIDVRSESAAVMAADGYGRVSRKVGVALVSGGPAHANTTTGLTTAMGNSSPVLLISGEPELAAEGRGRQQDLDHVGISKPVTKWSRRVVKSVDVTEALVEAFRVARGGRPGPTHVSIPADVLRSQSPEPVTPPFLSARPVMGVAPPEFVRETATLLSSSNRPAIVAGAGAWMAGAEDALFDLVEAARIPLFTIDSARGIVTDVHPAVFGSADASLNDVASLLREADVILLVGRDLDFRLQFGTIFNSRARIVAVDMQLEALGRNRPAHLACLADPARFLRDLRVELGGKVPLTDSWRNRLAEEDSRWLRYLEAQRTGLDPIHPADAAFAIRQSLEGSDAVKVFDCGDFVQWCRMILPAESPGRWLRLGSQSTCGAGLPFAIGASAALPDVPILVVAGDGGIAYHISELETATRHRLEVTVVVGTDCSWGLERHLQEGIYGKGHAFASDLGPVDFPAIASGFGADGRHVRTAEELKHAVESALSDLGPSCIQVPITPAPSLLTQRVITREKERTRTQAMIGNDRTSE